MMYLFQFCIILCVWLELYSILYAKELTLFREKLEKNLNNNELKLLIEERLGYILFNYLYCLTSFIGLFTKYYLLFGGIIFMSFISFFISRKINNIETRVVFHTADSLICLFLLTFCLLLLNI